jgi:hypothetical protein
MVTIFLGGKNRRPLITLRRSSSPFSETQNFFANVTGRGSGLQVDQRSVIHVD